MQLQGVLEPGPQLGVSHRVAGHAYRHRHVPRTLRVLVSTQTAALHDRQDDRTELSHIATLIEPGRGRGCRKGDAEVAPEMFAAPLQRLQGVNKHRAGQYDCAITL